MFPSSTQRKYWTYGDENEITLLRKEANDASVNYLGRRLSDEERSQRFLSPYEEKMLVKHFEFTLKEFCGKFQPPMPKCVVGTAITFMKRMFVHNSVMDYHPRDIMLTCVYLSCKVEEFYVPIGQFVSNLKGNREKFADIVLGFELLLLQKLHYHLTVHNIYRPLEGLFIELKTRCDTVQEVEKLRRFADDFIDKCLVTDIPLLFTPSQIALAAVLSSASNQGINLDSYITRVLMADASKLELEKTISKIKDIRAMMKNQEYPKREVIQIIQKKLEKCRNQDNNPDSEVYKRKMEELFQNEDEIQSQKRARIDEDSRVADQDLIS